MKLNRRYACFGVVLAAMLLTPAIASADRGGHYSGGRHYDRGDRYVRSSSRSSFDISVGFGFGSRGYSDRSYGSVNYRYHTPIYRESRYYDHAPRIYAAPRVEYHSPRIYVPAPSYCAPPTYYYSAPRTYYYAPAPSYSYSSYDYCAPRYYYGR